MPRHCGALPKRKRRQPQIQANSQKEAPIAVLRFFNGLRNAS